MIIYYSINKEDNPSKGDYDNELTEIGMSLNFSITQPTQPIPV